MRDNFPSPSATGISNRIPPNIRFFDLLDLAPGAVVVADNILSHDLFDYVAHVRKRDDVESMTLPIGKGLEVTQVRARERQTS